MKMTKKILKTEIFNFEYKEHQYTFKDSARNQSLCPHCGRSSENIMYSEKDKGFIGKAHLQDNMYAMCFECPECFKNFFYHKEEEEWKKK